MDAITCNTGISNYWRIRELVIPRKTMRLERKGERIPPPNTDPTLIKTEIIKGRTQSEIDKLIMLKKKWEE